MTKTCILDYDSIAGADKFGNIFVLRVPADVSDDIDNPTGASGFCLVCLGLLAYVLIANVASRKLVPAS